MLLRHRFLLFLLFLALLGLQALPPSGATAWFEHRNVQAPFSSITVAAPAPPQASSYAYHRTITIDHTKVPNTDQNNFPVLISGTYSYLATVANGGNVQNANGYDVIFASDTGCATKLDHEVETYNATTGAVNYWVKIPLLSHTSDTTVYLCYGNSSVTSDQSNKTAAWDANYKGVWHLSDGSTLNASDSTANGNNGTITGAVATAGRTDGGASLNGTSDHIQVKAGKVDTSTTTGTVSAWVKVSALDENGVVLGYGGAAATNAALWGVYIREVSGSYYFAMSARKTNSGVYNTVRGNTALSSGTWYYVTYSTNGSAWKIRVNGATAETLTNVLGTNTGDWVGDISPTTPDKSDIGAVYAGGAYSNVNFWHGIVDEVRLSNVERGDDWVSTEYNNQSSPATFYSISASSNCCDTSVARLDPVNETGGRGENPLSRNFNWTLPLLSLPGRAGMDLGLSLAYNSLVWTRNGSSISFDDDRGFPSPGFRLGFPVVQPLYFNSETGKNAYLLISSDGGRTELRQVGTSTLYESADSAHLLLDAATMILRSTDGTQLSYAFTGTEYDCTQIKDRNGNYITINYTPAGRIDTVIDTLARSIKFNYDSSGSLTSITQIWNQGTVNQVTHNWATFTYANISVVTNFQGLNVYGPASIKGLASVTLADGSHSDFSYTSWGQVWKLSGYAADNYLLNYRSYKLPGSPLLPTPPPQSDCPRFMERHDWAQYWNGDTDGTAVSTEEAVTTFAEPAAETFTMPDGSSPSGTRAQVTEPDGTSHKIYYIGTAATASGWQRSLPALVNTYDSSGVLQRQAMTTWTQDNTAVSYQLNPRVLETSIYDPAGNHARTEITYQQFTFANGTSCQLPRDVYEYAADATTKLRSTRTDYHTSTSYTDRRILGVVTEKRLYEGDVNNGGTLMSKVGFFYDNENGASSVQGTDAPVQHDPNYSASFVTGRANLSSVRRYDVSNTAVFTTTKTKYNTAGAVVSSRDALDHEVTASYADSFSDGNNTRNTLAYPTIVTDPDGYSSTSKYHFDFGAVTYVRTPQPNVTTNTPGPERSVAFDIIGRLQQQTNLVNGAYTRFEYPTSTNRIDIYATIQEGLGEAHSFQITDGAGRVIATATDLPGSVGGFSGQRTVYDVMGRVIKTSNPTETSASGAPAQWTTAGDDAAAGWIYTQQTYDWKGRPLVTTNQDGTTKTASYAGCGCAGGEVVTLTDEGTIDAGVAKKRQQKIYKDVLGRQVKTENLNWQGGSVYSATVNTYNARDQLTRIRQYAGAEGSGTFQDTSMFYDGYGRLQTKHVPEQQDDPNNPDDSDHTTWTYNADSSIQSVKDARGAVTALGYTGNNRGLVTSITYSMPGKPNVTTSFTYDAVGNRTSMTDAMGSVTYTRDQLSQLKVETRLITGLGSYSLLYDYNLAGTLTSITDPFGAQIGYSYDSAGRPNQINGSSFGGVNWYASNLKFRAWGGLKSLTYFNSKTLNLTYNSRLQPLTYEVPGIIKKNYQYYDDARLRFTQDQLTTNSKFDRKYEYDHIGRVTKALSGQEARDQGTTSDRPYNEAHTYDEFDHLRLRFVRQWSRLPSGSGGVFSNNRMSNWEYDSDGNPVSGSTGSYSYDAAGSVESFGDSAPYKTDQQFDGDKLRIKSVLKSFDSQSSQWMVEKVTYYIHSTVLGGAVVSELDEQGGKERTYVHWNGAVLAVQNVIGSTQSVQWKHFDATTATYRVTNSSGQVTESAEMDAVGANAGLFNSSPWPSPKSSGELQSYFSPGDLNGAAECYMGSEQKDGVQVGGQGVDEGGAGGVPMPCVLLESMARGDAIGSVKSYGFSMGSKHAVWINKDTSWGTSDTDHNVVTIYSGPGGEYVWVDDHDAVLQSWVNPAHPSTNTLKPIDWSVLESSLKTCISELWSMFEMTSFTPVTAPASQKGEKDDDSYNGIIGLNDIEFGKSFSVVNDPTPPLAVRNDLINKRARGSTDRFHPFWTYSYPAGDLSARPGELRYPELFGQLLYVRVQIHETGAALSYIRDLYHPGPWAIRLNDGGLDPDHTDDGPSLEDCVGREYYKQMGLTAHNHR